MMVSFIPGSDKTIIEIGYLGFDINILKIWEEFDTKQLWGYILLTETTFVISVNLL